jgi:site-specific recombinase XerC
VQDWTPPKVPHTLPRFLSLEESRRLLSSVDGGNRERDYCILCIFLNCGLRISEIVGLNLGDIRADHIRILGKGNKERIVYLNEATASAINDYLLVRRSMPPSTGTPCSSQTGASA